MAVKLKKQNIVRILLVEDDQDRIDWFDRYAPIGFTIVAVQSAGRAIGLLERDNFRDNGHVFAGIMLDCDLDHQTVLKSEHDMTGVDVVNAIVRNISPETAILIHSMNPKEAPKMTNMLTSSGFDLQRLPFNEMTPELFNDWLDEVKDNWEDLLDD